MTLAFIIVISLLADAFGGGVIGSALAAEARQSAHATASDLEDTGDRSAKPARVRGRQTIYPEQIRKAIQSYLQRQFAGKVQEIRVTLGEPQQPIGVPAGALTLTVGSMDGDDSVGRRVFQVHVAVNGHFVRTVEATTDVAAYVDILTPVRLIKADAAAIANYEGEDYQNKWKVFGRTPAMRSWVQPLPDTRDHQQHHER